MKKNKKKLGAIIAIVVVLAIAVTSIVTAVVYNVALKPKDFGKFVPVSGDKTGYYRHNYDELNANEKAVYGAILQSVYTQPEKIEIPQLTDGDLTKIFRAISYDNPDLFNLGLNCKVYKKGYKTFFEPEYSMTKDEYFAAFDKVKNVVTDILNFASQFTSTYEREKYAHDYIINHCTYVNPDQSKNANNIYGCLVEGKASCEGYSRAFQYVLSLLSIDNRIITGESADDGINFIGHMWNFVTIDGENYFVDLTWDDPKAEGNVLRHTYFNVTSRDIQVKHRNIEQQVPLCTSTKYNYFVYENAFFDAGSGEDFENDVLNLTLTAIQRKAKCVEMRFSSLAVMEQAKNTLFKVGSIYTIFKDAGIIKSEDEAKVFYSCDSKTKTICVYM